nr:MAG TPA: hypothetical protein [Caudoviricetes sp.]
MNLIYKKDKRLSIKIRGPLLFKIIFRYICWSIVKLRV